MQLQLAVVASLALAGSAIASPIYQRNEDFKGNNTVVYVKCDDSSKDPLCALVRPPISTVMTTTLLEDGTWSEAVPSNWTRESLKAFRVANNVTSNLPSSIDPVSRHLNSKREAGPPVCTTERQNWYDQHEWGYWYQAWAQVGNCFYCDTCSEAIATSFAVSETWTFSLGVDFDKVMQLSFGYSWGQTYTLGDTRTCNWVKGNTYGCHTIWYQPLMSWHHGYANYQTHGHCFGNGQVGPSDSYYDHNYKYAEANNAANGGTNQGNLGCGSGCSGSDHRQCHGNNGGVLWPYAN
ncbi:hypothetical protein B7463_g2256, partial [Scytalidium lignicola]